MASTKEYRDYILEQLSLVSGITCRPMMGEFLLYADGVLFGGIYEDGMLMKKTETNAKYGMPEVVPYEGSKKTMYSVEEYLDDKEQLAEIVNATVRGDSPIRIGENSNVQDNAVLHGERGHEINVGDGVTIGHGAIVHGCTVGSNTIVGMGAIILNDAVIGENCIIGAGALVTQGKTIPAGSLVIGSPAVVKRPLTAEEIEGIRENAAEYAAFAKKYAGA